MGLHKDSRIPRINMWTPWTSYKYTNFRKGEKESKDYIWNPWTYRDFGTKYKIYRNFSRFQ